MSISPINSPEHQKHADGLTDALAMKAIVYKPDPEPRIHRTVPREEWHPDFFTPDMPDMPDMPDGWDSEGGSLD